MYRIFVVEGSTEVRRAMETNTKETHLSFRVIPGVANTWAAVTADVKRNTVDSLQGNWIFSIHGNTPTTAEEIGCMKKTARRPRIGKNRFRFRSPKRIKPTGTMPSIPRSFMPLKKYAAYSDT